MIDYMKWPSLTDGQTDYLFVNVLKVPVNGLVEYKCFELIRNII